MKKTFALLFLSLGVLFFANAQNKIFNYLNPGSYKVGLKIIQTYDYSRTFGGKTDENGGIKNNARPIQILVWYPAQGEGKSLCYKDYILTGFTEIDFSPITNEQKEKIIENHKRAFLKMGADSAKMNSVLNRESYAIPQIQAIEGKFPLVVYAPGGNERCYENFILAEYLASHGYIVASIALTGDGTQQMAFEAADYESSVDDISFVIANMHNFPNVDNSKLALAGFCWGGMTNVMMANRNSNVDVIVDLFGVINSKETRGEVESYRYNFLKNPNLAYIQLAGAAEERDSYFFENSLYGDVYQARFNRVSHGAFTSNYVVKNHYFKGKLPTGQSNSFTDTVDVCYKNVCRYALEMLNAYIKKDKTALQFLNNEPIANGMNNLIYHKRKAIALPPTPNEFIKMARTEGVSKAKQTYNDVRSKDKNWKLFNENQMINFGYQLFGKGNTDDAIEIFTMLSLDYPKSWNAFDSLGEVYMKNGNKELAIENYEKSLKLNPNNTNAVEMLKKIKGGNN